KARGIVTPIIQVATKGTSGGEWYLWTADFRPDLSVGDIITGVMGTDQTLSDVDQTFRSAPNFSGFPHLMEREEMWGMLVSVGVNLLAAGVNYLLRDDDPEIDAQAQAQRGMESRPVASGDSIPVVYGSVGVSAKVIWAAPATSGNGDDVRAWQVGRTLSQTGGVWDPATD